MRQKVDYEKQQRRHTQVPAHKTDCTSRYAIETGGRHIQSRGKKLDALAERSIYTLESNVVRTQSEL